MFCNDCEKFFDEPVTVMEKDTGYVEQVCPHCCSDYITDSHRCSCDTEISADNQFCEKCRNTVTEALKELKEKLGFSQNDFEDIIANHFGW